MVQGQLAGNARRGSRAGLDWVVKPRALQVIDNYVPVGDLLAGRNFDGRRNCSHAVVRRRAQHYVSTAYHFLVVDNENISFVLVG